MLTPNTVLVFVTNACNLRCEYCIAADPYERDEKTMLDLEVASKWISRFAPKCEIHIMGGEPFRHPNCSSFATDMVEAGHDVTIMTNATLLPGIKGVYSLPVKWHLTHHPESGIGYDSFFAAIGPLRNTKHVVARVFHGYEALNHQAECEARYAGWNFRWIAVNNGYANYKFHTSVSECPNESMVLIGTKGEIFCCSKPKKGCFGNVHDMTFDVEGASQFRCSIYPAQCQAMQTIEIMREL